MHDRHIKQRIDYIDTAKAAAITLVIIGHTPVYEPLAKWIYVFHIPLFFFISGYLFSFGRNPTFGAFARKRRAQIAVPYAAVNIISYLFWLAVCGYGTRLPHGCLWPNLLLSAACLAVCCTLIYAYRRLKARLLSRGQAA